MESGSIDPPFLTSALAAIEWSASCPSSVEDIVENRKILVPVWTRTLIPL
jgi:hypothetical protein